eukprot:30256_1
MMILYNKTIINFKVIVVQMMLAVNILCVSLLLIKCHSLCDESQPCNLPSISPTDYPTFTTILKYQVQTSIEFEFTYNNTKSTVNIMESLKTSTIYILNDIIHILEIKCYSSDYITDIEILVIYEENGAIAKQFTKINATVLLCDITNTNKLLTYFKNILSQNQLIETKYKHYNHAINPVAHTSNLMAISNDYKSVISTTQMLKQQHVSEAITIVEKTVLITLLLLLCMCIVIITMTVIVRKRYMEHHKKLRIKTIDIFQMPQKQLKITEMTQSQINIQINDDSESENDSEIIPKNTFGKLSDTIVIVAKGNDVPKIRSPEMSFVTDGFIMDVNNIHENSSYEGKYKFKTIGSEFDQLDGDTIQ